MWRPIAALRAVRAQQPAKLITAATVASPRAVRQIAAEAGGVVCVEVPEVLYAVTRLWLQIAAEPLRRPPGHLRQGARFFEEVRGDHQPVGQHVNIEPRLAGVI